MGKMMRAVEVETTALWKNTSTHPDHDKRFLLSILPAVILFLGPLMNAFIAVQPDIFLLTVRRFSTKSKL